MIRFATSLGLFAVLCAGQASAPAPGNPRSGADDPRIGLKPGLYDAGEAAFGLERVTSLAKPPGFAPVAPDPNASPTKPKLAIPLLALIWSLRREPRRGPDAVVNLPGPVADGRASRRAKPPHRAVRWPPEFARGDTGRAAV